MTSVQDTTQASSDSLIIPAKRKLKFDGNLFSAFSCSICLNPLKKPKMLPGCGHSFCENCLENIIKTNGRVSACPECRTEAKVTKTSIKTLKANIAIQRVVDAFDGEVNSFPMRKKPCILGKKCPHVPLFTSSAEVCSHCEQSFCPCCLPLHMENLKLEINIANSGFDERLSLANKLADEKAEAAKKLVEEMIEKAKSDLLSEFDTLMEKLKTAVLNEKDRLFSEIEHIGQQLKTKIDNAVSFGKQAPETVESFKIDVDNVSRQWSVIHLSAQPVMQLHQRTIDFDKKLWELENLEENVSAKFVDQKLLVKDLLESVSRELKEKCSVTLADKELEELEMQNSWLARWRITQLKSKKSKPVLSDFVRIHKAAKNGDFQSLRAVFARPGLSMSSRQYLTDHKDREDFKNAVLFQAAEKGDLDTVKFLVLEQNAGLVSGRTFTAELTALHVAARYGNLDVLKFLIGFYDSLKARPVASIENINNELLDPASSHGQLSIVKYLIYERKADCLLKGKYGRSAFDDAVSNGHLNVVKFLYDDIMTPAGEDKNISVKGFFDAIFEDHLDVVKFISERHPEFLNSKKDSDGYTALLQAGYAKKSELIEYLIDAGADASEVDKNGWTPLHVAAEGDNVKAIRVFAKRCPEMLEKEDNAGFTPLNLAANMCNVKAVKYLANECHANLHHRTFDGRTPLLQSCDGCGLETIKALLDAGANLWDLQEKTGNSVLHFVAASTYSPGRDIIDFLVEKDAKLLRATNENGDSPLDIAVSKSHGEVARILRQHMISF